MTWKEEIDWELACGRSVPFSAFVCSRAQRRPISRKTIAKFSYRESEEHELKRQFLDVLCNAGPWYRDTGTLLKEVLG